MGKLIDTEEINISRYREWSLNNYGESGKTKTVTKRKYERIMKVLRGKERFTGSASSESGKFRFWVRGKGFKLGKPLGLPVVGPGDEVLLVPVKSTSADGTIVDKGYKQVAVVEDFYDIIYNIHVQTEGKEGKHAGQKRTYRAVAEKFAFLPREAVTRFLMSCKDCKTRMQLTFESSDMKKLEQAPISAEPEYRKPDTEIPDIQYGLPITTTYYSHLRNLQYISENEDLLSEASFETDMTEPSIVSETRSMGSVDAATIPTYEAPLDLKKGEGRVSAGSPVSRSPAKERSTPSPPKLQKGSNGVSFPLMVEAGKDAPEDLSLNKDDDDDDDGDDDSEKANEPTPAGVDPERLKSFNMFVRLFVDENLDRIVPISKQPKEKIQAIIEACYRQFPEFHERARKRIRTYLKSCRRMKRQRDQNGIDSSTIRPTPPHLTSARAEQILAAACESESENARRMRMELLQQQQQIQQQHTTQPTVPVQSEPQSERTSVTNQATPSVRPVVEEAVPKPLPRTAPIPYQHFENGVSGGPHEPYFVAPQHQNQIPPAAVIQHTPITNGPTDLSVKKLSSSKAQLSPTEIANIRQLITSYRESAAFLYRSADELEQMLLQLN